MTRGLWLRLHRWIGLTSAGFLIVAGLTGSLLVWYDELDTVSAADLRRITPTASRAPVLDRLALRERVIAAYPNALVDHVELTPPAPGQSARFFLEPRPPPQTEGAPPLPNDEIFVNPTDGHIVGERKWGDILQGSKNLMPFVYRLHYTLALGGIGSYTLGVIALLWTLDCFIGVYLTFPSSRKRRHPPRGWWQRWRPSWQVRWASSAYKVTFDLHRAVSLWLWAMLFVLAWSSVSFNLTEVYHPVMKAVFAFDQEATSPPLAVPQAKPGLSWREAHAQARRLMQAEASAQGFEVLQEQALSYDSAHAVFRYTVRSSADVGNKYGATRLVFDANSGVLRHLFLPSGRCAGDTVTRWLMHLHTATVWGMPMRLFVCAMGVAVTLLSVTGVLVWNRKRRGRLARRSGR